MKGKLIINGKLVLMVLAIGLAIGGAGWAGYGGLRERSQPAPLAKAQVPGVKKPVNVAAKEDPSIAVDQYGDPLPAGAVARLGARRFRQEGNIWELIFTSDGKTLVGSTNTSGVVIWDATTGKERFQIPVRMAPVPHGIDVSPDGTTLAISETAAREDEAKISLFDLESGKKTRSLSLPFGEGRGKLFWYLQFTPDGKSLASTYFTGGKIAVFDLASATVRSTIGAKGLQFSIFAFSPDKKTVAVIAEPSDPAAKNTRALQLLDIATQKLIISIPGLPVKQMESIFGEITFSPDGKKLAFAFPDQILVFDCRTGKELGQLDLKKIGQPRRGLSFTPDGEKLVAGAVSKGFVWNVGTGEIQDSFGGHGCYSIALSRDGKTAALGTNGRTVRFWDVATAKQLHTEYESHDFPITGLAFSPDGKALASAALYRPVLLWDMTSKTRSGTVPGGARTLSFSANGKQLATVGPDRDDDTSTYWTFSTKVQIWNTAVPKKAFVFSIPNVKDVTSAIFSSDGRKLTTLDWNGYYSDFPNPENYIRQWDVTSGKQDHLRKFSPQRNWKPSLAPDGKRVFATLMKGGFGIYDVDSGRERLIPGRENEETYVLTPSPDASVLAFVNGPKPSWGKDSDFLAFGGRLNPMGAPSSDVRLCEVVTGREIYLLTGHQGGVCAIAWSPNGRLLASGDALYDTWNGAQSVRLWDTATGKQLASFAGFNTDLTALTFSPDAKNLAAGLRDGTILVFDVENANPNLATTAKLNTDELEARWTDLIANNIGRAHQALWALACSPKQSVPFIRNHLKPAVLADQAKIQKWLADLDSEKFLIRQGAAKELQNVGEQVEVTIQKALKGNISLETRRRLDQILKNLPDVPGPETVRSIRAIMALERIGSPEAQDVLEALARGAPGARETEEAKASLERLKQRASRVP